MITLTAPYEHTSDRINVEKITSIPYESPNAQRNAKEIKLTAQRDHTNIRTKFEKITLISFNVPMYAEMSRR